MPSDIQDELNDIFNALAGSASGLVPVSTASSVLGAAVQAVSAPRASGSSGGGIGRTLETVGLDILKSGFGLAPIIGGLLGLFGGGNDSSALPPLVKYTMPDAVSYQAAEVGGQIENVDYGQSGTPRGFAGNAVPAITVNVQAMDSQSFLDRSSDIAAAVRQAMLNLNSINDVVNEL